MSQEQGFVAHLGAVHDGKQALPFGELGLRGRLLPDLLPQLFENAKGPKERRAMLAEAQGNVIGRGGEVLFVKEIAVEPRKGVVGLLKGQAEFVYFVEGSIPQSIDLKQLAVCKNAQVVLRMALIANVGGEFLKS